MAEKELMLLEELAKQIKATNERIERMKKVITDYLTLANEFAVASVRTSLKNI